jgi:hypothetical protein
MQQIYVAYVLPGFTLAARLSWSMPSMGLLFVCPPRGLQVYVALLVGPSYCLFKCIWLDSFTFHLAEPHLLTRFILSVVRNVSWSFCVCRLRGVGSDLVWQDVKDWSVIAASSAVLLITEWCFVV